MWYSNLSFTIVYGSRRCSVEIQNVSLHYY
jgi:hypothetical protein